MHSQPPETKFYDDGENRELWDDEVRRYQKFCGPDSTQWSEREERFVTMMNDFRVRLREIPRQVQV